MSPSRGSAPPSPTVAKRTADGPDWHAIGCGVRDLVGAVLSSWFQKELQQQQAHRRCSLPQEGVRSTRGVYFRKRQPFPAFLATGAYNGRYVLIGGRCGRRRATHNL